MADEIDVSVERQMILEEANVQEARNRAAAIPVGEPGECDYCGETFARLVNGACGRCRDRYRLP